MGMRRRANVPSGFSAGLQSQVSKARPGAPGVLLGLTMLFASMLGAQEMTLHVDVKLVNVFVNVTDRNGAIVGGLTRDDFAVTEDGRPQQISVFERQSELPLNVTLA